MVRASLAAAISLPPMGMSKSGATSSRTSVSESRYRTRPSSKNCGSSSRAMDTGVQFSWSHPSMGIIPSSMGMCLKVVPGYASSTRPSRSSAPPLSRWPMTWTATFLEACSNSDRMETSVGFTKRSSVDHTTRMPPPQVFAILPSVFLIRYGSSPCCHQFSETNCLRKSSVIPIRMALGRAVVLSGNCQYQLRSNPSCGGDPSDYQYGRSSYSPAVVQQSEPQAGFGRG